MITLSCALGKRAKNTEPVMIGLALALTNCIELPLKRCMRRSITSFLLHPSR